MSRVQPAPSVRDVLKSIEQSGGELQQPVAPEWHSSDVASTVPPGAAGIEPLEVRVEISEPVGYQPDDVARAPRVEADRPVRPSRRTPASAPASAPASGSARAPEAVVPDHHLEVHQASAGVAADLLAGASAAAQQIVEKASADRDAILAEARSQAAALVDQATAVAEGLLAEAQAEADAHLAERLREMGQLADGLAEMARKRLSSNGR